MAGVKHQFILGLVIRSMRQFGCIIQQVDGDYRGKLGQALPIPSSILRHRPDAIGFTTEGILCIGDAKTESDITSRRTIEQIVDFCSYKFDERLCEVFIGIPKSCKYTLEKTLREQGFSGYPYLHIITVPDEIICDET